MAPKTQTQSRFRNRKINFKVKLPIHVGSFDIIYDEPTEAEATTAVRASEDGAADQDKERAGVETGVDKEEEGEVHLQNAISASAAALVARTAATRSAAVSAAVAASTSAATRKEAASGMYIPTPDATGLVDDYAALYPQSAFAEPSTYIRFSDTVEDAIGVAYTMDEEDVDFLQSLNAQYAQRAASASTAGPDHSRPQRSPRRDKGKEPASTAFALSEDDFEAIMDHFEGYTEERVPALHTDFSQLPSLPEMEAMFTSAEYPRLGSLKLFARVVYSHWKERRLKREGFVVIPQLDYDETREDNPYVCFRRREAKLLRKTRRTEVQNVDRLNRLRTDLTQARDLLQMVVERERLKRDVLRDDLAVLDARARLRDLKRRANENEGDDDVLLPKERKRRRRMEETMPPQTAAPSAMHGSTFKTTLRIPGRDSMPNASGPAPSPCVEPLMAFRDRTQHVSHRIDRDMERKRGADREWEDFSDGAFLPFPQSAAVRHYRTLEVPSEKLKDPAVPPSAFVFSAQPFQALGPGRPVFRKRVGRGGRIHMDRVLQRGQFGKSGRCSGEDDTSEEHARLRERWRYDSDLPSEHTVTQSVIDDYALPNVIYRLGLLRDGDLNALKPSSHWVDHVHYWLAREPDDNGKITVIGKLPSRQLPPAVNGTPMVSSALAMHPFAASVANGSSAGASHSLGSPAMPASVQNAAVMSQMIMAATHAQQVAQSQTQLRRANGSPSVGSLSPQSLPSSATHVRRTSSMNGLVASPALALGGGGSSNTVIATSLQQPQQSWPNGLGSPGKPLDFAANSTALLAQMMQQQQNMNGMHRLASAMPTATSGPSGTPGTRLSPAAPLVNGVALPHVGAIMNGTAPQRSAGLARPSSQASNAGPQPLASPTRPKRGAYGTALG